MKVVISVLYIDPKGVYADAGLDLWGLPDRDARYYVGPNPVIAHPPCGRWCKYAPVNQARYGHAIGDDGECFNHALWAVRECGGVLEHPASSIAFRHFTLPRPDFHGGWTEPDEYGGRSCHVEQGQYGHPARKGTWLYAVGACFPDLRWGRGPSPEAWVGFGDHANVKGKRRLSPKEGAATPAKFRDLLISIARSVKVK